MMYSAAIRNSSTVADRPRFSSTGLRAFPARFSSEKFCMLRAPIWITSAYFSTRSSDSFGRGQRLLARLDGTRAGDHRHFLTAEARVRTGEANDGEEVAVIAGPC